MKPGVRDPNHEAARTRPKTEVEFPLFGLKSGPFWEMHRHFLTSIPISPIHVLGMISSRKCVRLLKNDLTGEGRVTILET
jgi:hypothetical protein